MNTGNITSKEWRAAGSYFESGERQMFYRIDGRGDRFLLCLHGFPTSSFDYRKIWQILGDHFRVIAADMIGYGFSSKPKKFGYTTFDQADAIESLIEYLNVDRLHILSHDYGNTITQEFLARQDEGRLGFRIDSICMLNGALFPETHRPILAQRLLISPVGALFGRFIPDAVFKKNLAAVFGPRTQPNDRELNEFLDVFDFNRGKKIAHKLIRYMTERARFRERWVAPLKYMRQPFRFINGLADPVSGAHLVARFREVVPDQTDIIELPGIGHFPHFEVPETVIRHFLEFHYRLSAKS